MRPGIFYLRQILVVLACAAGACNGSRMQTPANAPAVNGNRSEPPAYAVLNEPYFDHTSGALFNNSSWYRVGSFLPANPSEVAAIRARVDATLFAHPRVLVSAQRLSNISQTLHEGTDPDIVHYYQRFKIQVSNMMSWPPVSYGANGEGMLAAGRQAQSIIEHMILAYAVERDPAYFNRARTELLAITDAVGFPDWAPTQQSFHAVAGFALAAAEGLSHFYDALSPAERDQIQRALVDRALAPAIVDYENSCPNAWEGSACTFHFWTSSGMNITTWSNSGLLAGAVAVADRFPDVASKVIANALKGLALAGASFDRGGAGGAEGTQYAQVTASHFARSIDALELSLGSSLGLAETSGLRDLGHYLMQLGTLDSSWIALGQSENGLNWTDPVLFWFGKRFGDSRLSRFYHDLEERRSASRADPEVLFYYDPAWKNASPDSFSRSAFFPGIHTSVIRSSWTDPAACVMALQGGRIYNHQPRHLGAIRLRCFGTEFLRGQGYDSSGIYASTTFGNTLQVDGRDQASNDRAGLIRYSASPDDPFAVVDLTHTSWTGGAPPGTPGPVISWRRGIRLGNWPRIQDEISVTAGRAVVWSAFTDAAVALSSGAATLSLNGKRIRLLIESPVNAQFAFDSTAQRLSISLTSTGSVQRVTVLVFPEKGGGFGSAPDGFRADSLESWWN